MNRIVTVYEVGDKDFNKKEIAEMLQINEDRVIAFWVEDNYIKAEITSA